jgi:hypothetical protein
MLRSCVAALVLFAHVSHAVDVSVSLSAPKNARVVSPSLFSFSIEMDRWTDWVGSTSQNKFLYNTLNNLKRLSGQPPQIRIGGNTEDRTVFKEDAKVS